MKTRAHILLQALSGKGKTFWSVTGGKPFVLAPEFKCRTIIPIINPNAYVHAMDTREDYDKAIAFIQDQRLA